MDVLAFGERRPVELAHLPRAGVLWAGPSWVADAVAAGGPWEREAAAGPLALPAEVSPRPGWIVHRDDVESPEVVPSGTAATALAGSAWRRAASRPACATSRSHPDENGYPRHCHSAEEELFVIVGGSGTARVGDEEAPVRAGHVLSRPAGTRLAHSFRAGPDGLECLAYGQRDNNDIIYYPDSRKVSFAGIGVIARIESLEYWDGEDLPG